ncbi:hypothetical protein PWT90_03611 [Aphanocladium album]|nr:hypothetical protein PWT90_03611 [Aphanocladium album]
MTHGGRAAIETVVEAESAWRALRSSPASRTLATARPLAPKKRRRHLLIDRAARHRLRRTLRESAWMEANLNTNHAGEDVDAARGQTLGADEIETHVARVGGGIGAVPFELRLDGLRDTGLNGHSDGTINTMEASTHPNASVTTPPYWQNMPSRRRAASTQSSDSGRPAGAIQLLDHEADEEEDRNNACWAKSVEIVDYTIVNGGATSIGAFVVWNVRVETLQGSYMNIRKRYSEFDALRQRLMKSFPNFDAAVPSLPPKSVISKFRPKFLEKRRAGLQYFLK